MSVSVEQLEEWMSGFEDEHLEFKEARNQYGAVKLVRYCSALANEHGKMMLRVTTRDCAAWLAAAWTGKGCTVVTSSLPWDVGTG